MGMYLLMPAITTVNTHRTTFIFFFSLVGEVSGGKIKIISDKSSGFINAIQT